MVVKNNDNVCACLMQRQVGNAAQVGKLLDELERCGPDAFGVFVEALKESGHEHQAALLTDAERQAELLTETSHNSGASEGNYTVL